MEPGIPDWRSRPSRLGLYSLYPAVRFWATPPVHGCLAPEVIHPAILTFKLPDNVRFAEGACVEPLAVGLQVVTKAHIAPGETAVVLGAGTIGMITALAALAAGCARVIVTDVKAEKLELAASTPGIITLDVAEQDAVARVGELADEWGADVVFEASGSMATFNRICELACPAAGWCSSACRSGRWFDVVAAQVKELRIEHVFRYAHIFPHALALMSSGTIDVKPLISRTFPFAISVEAFAFAAEGRPEIVKPRIAFNRAGRLRGPEA